MKKTNPTRQLLLAHGLKLVAQKGLRGMVIRELAQETGVNLGSVVYHFGTREKFLEEVVDQWYSPFVAQLQSAAQRNHDLPAVVALERVIGELIDLIDRHASFIAHLGADALAGEPAAQRFLINLRTGHPKILLRLIRQGQRNGTIVQAPPLHLLSFIMSTAALPMILAAEPLLESDWLPPTARQLTEWMASSKGARQRLAWALRGIQAAQSSS